MRRAATILALLSFACVASAQAKPADERFFDAFLPLMVGVGMVIVFFVIVTNVVARRRSARRASLRFDPTLGPGPSPFTTVPNVPPRTVSKTTTTTSADGSVTVTVVEETVSSTRLNANGVVDPELLGGVVDGGALQQEILNEVRDAFRRIENQRNSPS